MRTKFVVAVALAAACARQPAPDVAPRAASELDRIAALHASVAKADLPEGMRAELDRYKPLIESARKTNDPVYRIYRLRAPFIGTETIAYVAARKAAAADMKSFEELWKREDRRFAALPAAGRGPLLGRALADGGFNRARKLYDASVTYGRVTSPLFGLYYLAEADASRKYAEFVRSIEFGGAEEQIPTPQALAAVAEELQRDMLAGFKKDPNGRSMVGASARMKEAREMIDGRRYAGATLALLEARLEISRQAGPAAPRQAVESPGTLGQLWSAVAREHDDANVKKIAAADVLPLLARLNSPAPAVARGQRPQVTVTLVRWPYT
jgi:hypothetical protein